MACLKCGKKTKEEQIFCPRCLEGMEAYPVKPDVHVQLPNRPGAIDLKKSARKRRVLSAEEQVPLLRRRIRRLMALSLVLLLLLVAAVGMLFRDYFAEEKLEIGKNYTYGDLFG